MSAQEAPVITVDGPSGVGKGTISQMLAQRLGWHFLDSGALYRLTALAARRRGVALDDEPAVAALAEQLPVRFVAGTGEPQIFLDEQAVTAEIRTETAGNDASKVAVLPAVRQALLARQRAFRQAPGLVADGRDMGTAVFPDAPVKLFLTARADVRAERRYNQLMEKGLNVSLASLLQDIEERDARDRSRAVSPLLPAEDAVLVDTSELNIEGVFEQVAAVVKDRIGFSL